MLREFKNILLMLYAGFLISSCSCYEGNVAKEKEHELEDEKINSYEEWNEIDMENAIQEVEFHSLTVEEISKTNDIPSENIVKLYDQMIAAVDDIRKAIKYPDNVEKFIKASGFIRILSKNLIKTHSELRTKLLLLIKDMFDTAPVTMDAHLPLYILDKLLDIFENDRNLGLKAHVLDILYKWLPNNPKAQARVMKVKGLETFYNQINKLDIGVIKTLMELFNKILTEHLKVRNDKAQVIQDDGERLVVYQRIGFLERMSTPLVCNGLLNVFEMLWSYNNNESDNIITVLNLLKNIKPFCSKIYKMKSKAIDLFDALLKYVKDKKEYLEKHDINVTDIVMVLEEYLDTENRLDAKDEL